MKRGLASPSVHSALATTRRDCDQLSTVDHSNSLKRRAAWPVVFASFSASASSGSICAMSRSFLAQPSTKCTPLLLHHVMRASRQKPLSARTRMVVSGQCSRM